MSTFLDDYRPQFDGYKTLMSRRIREILLVSSLYDAFILEEDGSLVDQIWEQYVERRLTLPPSIQRVSNIDDALRRAGDPRIDLVLTMSRLPGLDPVFFATDVKKQHPDLPVVIMATDPAELRFLPDPAERRRLGVDKVFLWNNDAQILLAIVKYFEDLLNVEHDTRTANVRVILLVEDSISRYSSFLPMMYTELMNLTRNLIDEGLNDLHKQLRMRSRAKVLHAETFEEGMELYARFKPYMLGVISDVSFWREGRLDEEAGFDFVRRIKDEKPHLPVVLQSADPGKNQARAWDLGASFLDKNSPSMLLELRDCLQMQMGFGDFVFRDTDGVEIDRARNAYELVEKLESVPVESVLWHAEHNHFSNWLAARTETTISDEIAPRRCEEFSSGEDVRRYIIGVISRVLTDKQSYVVTEFKSERVIEYTDFMHLGMGSMGGKGRGIAFVRYLLKRTPLRDTFPEVQIDVPATLVVGANEFDTFLDDNDLREFTLTASSPGEIFERFLAASMQRSVTESLRAYLSKIARPLAVRSSSLLEDSHIQPFAGLYATCMVPNNSATVDARLRDLVQAVKLVWASTFFPAPKAYFRSISRRIEEERMAVVIQELVGRRHGDHFYPTFSGVAQSYNFYPVGHMKADEGVVQVAVGLGKTIVEGGAALRFCPHHPMIMPQFPTVDDWLQGSQRKLFALRMDQPFRGGGPDPEANLELLDIGRAEEDGELTHLASVYSPDDHMIRDGLGARGPRVVTFAGILKHHKFPVNAIVKELLSTFAGAMGCPVEVEFAVNLTGPEGRPEFRVLQLRPLNTGHERESVEIVAGDVQSAWLRTDRSLGNGVYDDIRDIVYVRPDAFDRSRTTRMIGEVDAINADLLSEGRPYALIGFGRWGSADPWLGIGVTWDHISGARIIAEAHLEGFHVDPSQGSHFFHNMTSLGIGYLTIHGAPDRTFVDWDWLAAQRRIREEEHVSHVRLEEPAVFKIDGRSGRAVGIKPSSDPQ
jgi:hypothetical protein